MPPSPRPLPPAADVVVLGGGIAGLATAHHLARLLPPTRRIVLLDPSHRAGGWIHSERVPLPAPSAGSFPTTALVERGPHSLRPRGPTSLAMLQLVHQLGLWDRMLRVPDTAPSAQNRFIYSRGQINILPAGWRTLYRIFTSPALRASWTDALWDLVSPARPGVLPRPRSESPQEASRLRLRSQLLDDESIESFLTRRFGGRASLVKEIVSAGVHGIWAGDTRTLSVRSLMPGLWDRERTHGRLFLARKKKTQVSAAHMPALEKKVERARSQAAFEERVESTVMQASIGQKKLAQLAGTSIYSFPNGLGEIVDSLVSDLRAQPNVHLALGTGCSSLSPPGTSGGQFEGEESGVAVGTPAGTIQARSVVAAIPAHHLTRLVQSSASLPTALIAEPSATVGVVNIVVPFWVAEQIQKQNSASHGGNGQSVLQVEGFGVLVPRSEREAGNNPDAILGVIIDSDALPAQDAQPNIKLTIMLGGAHWSSTPSPAPQQLFAKSSTTPAQPDPSGHGSLSAPSVEEVEAAGCRAAQTIVGLHPSALSHPSTLMRTAIAPQCIPWYTVGHSYRLARLHEHLLLSPREGGWGGKLALTGASYTGVSLNDCVHHARRVAYRLAKGQVTTGLEPVALQAGIIRGIFDLEDENEVTG